MKTNALNFIKSKTSSYSKYWAEVLMVAICLTIALFLTGAGMSVFPAILIGASSAVVGTWFVVRIRYLIWIHVTRGAPFRKGDRVEVTEGPHLGKVGEVEVNDSECNRAWITLDGAPSESEPQHFRWEEIRKIGFER